MTSIFRCYKLWGWDLLELLDKSGRLGDVGQEFGKDVVCAHALCTKNHVFNEAALTWHYRAGFLGRFHCADKRRYGNGRWHFRILSQRRFRRVEDMMQYWRALPRQHELAEGQAIELQWASWQKAKRVSWSVLAGRMPSG